VREILAQCRQAGVAFFFKQWGGFNKKKNGRELDGRTWEEMPSGPRPRDRGQAARPSLA
jgi:protein gp37